MEEPIFAKLARHWLDTSLVWEERILSLGYYNILNWLDRYAYW